MVVDKRGSKSKDFRTMTVSYDHSATDASQKHEELLWVLIKDAMKSADFTLPSLTELHKSLSAAAMSDTSSANYIGQAAFKQVLTQRRASVATDANLDEVLMQRLFDGFSKRSDGVRLDIREFLREFICTSEAPVSERLALLCVIYDAENSGSIASRSQ